MRLQPKFSSFFLFLAMIVISAFLQVPDIARGNFWFTFDNARDYLWVRDMVIFKKPYLIGPWSSLGGVFFGPGWYYLLAIPFVFSQGDPRFAAFLVLVSIMLTALVAFIFISYEFKNIRLALITSYFILFSSILMHFSAVAFHANVLPLLTLILIVCLYYLDQKPAFFLSTSFFIMSLSYHFEPIFGLAITSGSFIYIFLCFKNKDFKFKYLYLFLTFIFFIIPFLPQLIFETRHDFLEIRSVILYFEGKNHTLSGDLPIVQRIFNRLDLFEKTWQITFTDDWLSAGFLLGLTFVFFISGKKQISNLNLYRLLTVLLSLLLGIFFFLVLMREEAKAWYVTGVPVIYILIVAMVFEWIFVTFPRARLYLIFLMIVLFFVGTKSWLVNFFRSNVIQDPSIFANEIKVIDFIYSDARGKGFAIYVYTPGVYDYPYQYLFWWYGNRHYGYFPEELAYLPDKPPEYVPNKLQHEAYLVRRKKELIYLIVEREPQYVERLKSWYSTFGDKSLPEERKIFPFGVFVEKRLPSI